VYFQSWKSGANPINIESLPAHTMQCFQLPKESNLQNDEISRDFFWKKKNSIKTNVYLWYLGTRYAGPRRLGGLD